MTDREYFRLDFSMAAVRREDFKAVQNALLIVRNRYCKGGSSVGISSVAEGTKISDD